MGIASVSGSTSKLKRDPDCPVGEMWIKGALFGKEHESQERECNIPGTTHGLSSRTCLSTEIPTKQCSALIH